MGMLLQKVLRLILKCCKSCARL